MRSRRQRDTSRDRENLRAWRASHPDEVRAQTERARQSRNDAYRANPACYLYRTAKYRAEKEGIPFSITPADITVPTTCPILDIPIDVCTSNYHNGASLDRVINELGYVPGNVRVISRKANRLKGDATIEEVERLLAYMKGEV